MVTREGKEEGRITWKTEIGYINYIRQITDKDLLCILQGTQHSVMTAMGHYMVIRK